MSVSLYDRSTSLSLSDLCSDEEYSKDFNGYVRVGGCGVFHDETKFVEVLKDTGDGSGELKRTAIFQIKKERTAPKEMCFGRELSSDDVKALAEVLKTNKTLKVLDLTQFNSEALILEDDGAKILAEGLKLNKTLIDVDIAYNGIGDAGARAIADVIKTNETIVKLSLWGNDNIGDEGASALAKALNTNKTLKILNVYQYDTTMSAHGVNAIKEAWGARGNGSELKLRE